MKTNHFMYIFLLGMSCVLFFFCSCEDAELALTNSAKVNMQVEWKDYSFHFSANISKPNNVEIKEQGFVFTYPQYYYDDYWSSWETISETFTIVNNTPFEYTVKEGWPAQMECSVYAYVKTNYGNYRSNLQVILTGAQEVPLITSVLQIPADEDVAWWDIGGTIYLEGSGFSKIPRRNKIWVDDGKETMWLEVVASSPTKIEATYIKGNWNKIGKFPMYLQVGNVKSLSEAYFEMNGTKLISVDPATFRYGDEVTLHLSDFHADENFHISLLGGSMDSSDPFKIISVADNEIKMRMYPQRDESVSVCFYDKNDKYGPEVPITLLNPWHQVANLDWKMDFSEHSNFCSYRNKGYVLDWDKRMLRCYNATTGYWSNYPLEIADDNRYSDSFQLFGVGDYIYMTHFYQKTLGVGIVNTQELYRFHLMTYTWEKLNNIANSLLSPGDFIRGAFTVWDENTVYIHPHGDFLFTYHVDTDTWEKKKVSQPYYIHLAGRYGDYLYYTDQRSFYRIKPEEPDKEEKILDGDCFISNVRNAVIHDKYMYFQQEYGMFRVDLSASPAKLESLGGLFKDESEYFAARGVYFSLDTGVYYLNSGKMYKYLE